MELYSKIEALCRAAKNAAPSLARAKTKDKNAALIKIAELLTARADEILSANKTDLEKAAENGVPAHMLDRLMLNESRIRGISDSLIEVANLTDPIGQGECWTRPSGINIRAVRAPLGVIAIIYEARPNVTVDAAALCIKTGNAVILRGGKEAINSSIALVNIMKDALTSVGLDAGAIGIVTDTSHEGANILMGMTEYVDVLIPRGSKRLIDAVKNNSKVPVIETGAG
ncbi:MAG: aldehyde dehydrogenase family protein, partial [Clostridia bacterium]|nr:aldehyde dehydrogenase family protein [Clostridia bacterium]